jgi:hypothetical protein
LSDDDRIEGSAPYGSLNESLEAAMVMAVYRGMPVATVGRGGGGFVNPTANRKGLFIGGSNLTAPKARMLLMACLLKFGSLPLPADPCAPTAEEEQAIRARVREYQEIFNLHQPYRDPWRQSGEKHRKNATSTAIDALLRRMALPCTLENGARNGVCRGLEVAARNPLAIASVGT